MTASQAMAGIVARLVAQIEAGAATWEMPWRNIGATGWPTNVVTGSRYHGGNVIVFAVAAAAAGYPSAPWATYKQWSSIDAQVRRGEQATCGIYWHTQPATDSDDTDATATTTSGGPVRWVRTFHVFNAAQVDNDPDPQPSSTPLDPLSRELVAEAWFANVPAAVAWGQGNPGYRPADDRIVMPPFDAFHTAADAYATLAHDPLTALGRRGASPFAAGACAGVATVTGGLPCGRWGRRVRRS